MPLMTLDEAIEWGDRGELCDLMTVDDQRQMACWLRTMARTAPRVIVSDPATDCATGHCECGECGGAIDMWDNYCKHCGVGLGDV